jgi:hypothetical protein
MIYKFTSINPFDFNTEAAKLGGYDIETLNIVELVQHQISIVKSC